MKPGLSSLGILILILLRAQAEQSMAPQLVTANTQASAEKIQDLQTPGEIVWQDHCNSDESLKKYFEIRGQKEALAIIDQTEGASHRGKGALRLTARAANGASSGAGATAWLGNGGYDTIHLRYYLRFAEDYDQGNLNHTGGSISAVSGINQWQGMGTAGKRPRGDDYFNSRFEAWCDFQKLEPPGYLFLYTYWMDMKQDRDGNYWGNMLGPDQNDRFQPKRGTWYCLEHMIRANTPGQNDGELAAWIDGKLYLHYTGIRWRSDPSVKIKRIDLGVYIHSSAQDNTVWFDDIAVSTGYIGPLTVE